MAVKATAKSSVERSIAHNWPPPQGKWTYDDYTRLPDNGMRYEVIEGDLYMSPAPSPKHQRVIVALLKYLLAHLENQLLGEVFISPIDVNLPNLTNPVQPDLLFIASDGLDIVKETSIEGVPDLIIEVLSPGNPAYDRTNKFQIYARAGVREYWIIDPEERTIEINVLRGQAYVPLAIFGSDDQTRSEVLADFTVPVGEVCPK